MAKHGFSATARLDSVTAETFIAAMKGLCDDALAEFHHFVGAELAMSEAMLVKIAKLKTANGHYVAPAIISHRSIFGFPFVIDNRIPENELQMRRRSVSV